MKKEEERSLAVDFDLDLDLDLLKERKQNDSPRRGLFLRFSSPPKSNQRRLSNLLKPSAGSQ